MPGGTLALTLCVAVICCAPPIRADDALTIVVAGPGEGRNSRWTRKLADAAREAAATLNASGGLLGHTLAVTVRDDECKAEAAAKLAATFVAEKPALVLGHPCASAAVSAADVYGKDRILYIATITRHPRLTAKRAGPTIFRLAGRDDRQGAAAGAMLARDFNNQTVALIQDRTKYASAINDGAIAAMRDAKVKPPLTASIVGGDKEYKATVAKTKDAAAVFFAGYPIEAGFVHAALRRADSKAQFFGSDSLATDEFATTFGSGAAGVRVLAVPSLDDDEGPFSALSVSKRTKAAITMFAEAARQAGTTDAASVAQLMSTGKFATDIGEIQFSKDGDALIPGFAILEWNGGKWITAGETPP